VGRNPRARSRRSQNNCLCWARVELLYAKAAQFLTPLRLGNPFIDYMLSSSAEGLLRLADLEGDNTQLSPDRYEVLDGVRTRA